MVSDRVSVKRRWSPKRLILIVIGIIFVVGVLYTFFFLGAVFGFKLPFSPEVKEEFIYVNPLVEILEGYEQQGIEINETAIINQAELEFDQDYINYVLFAMSAWKLHNPPFSSEKPIIRVVLDQEETYFSEVIDGQILTYGGDTENPDIVITTTKRETIQAMLAEDMAGFMKESVAQGRTGIEMLASTIKLASKGYLQMYEDITGEKLIG